MVFTVYLFLCCALIIFFFLSLAYGLPALFNLCKAFLKSAGKP